jgi:hypothetical protein
MSIINHLGYNDSLFLHFGDASDHKAHEEKSVNLKVAVEDKKY